MSKCKQGLPLGYGLAILCLVWVVYRLGHTGGQGPGTVPNTAASVPAGYLFVDYRGQSDVQSETRSCGGFIAAPPPKQRTNRVVSAVLYMNEEDLLHVRFLELYDVVDHFIVMEAPLTFQGDPKPLLFQKEVCRRFAAFAPKIVHVVVSSITNSSSLPQTGASEDWKREHASRNALQAAVDLLQLQPDDIMLTSDADEIPTAAAVQLGTNYLLNNLVSLATGAKTIPIVEFELKAYYYSLYRSYGNAGGAKMFPLWSTSICSFQDIRFTNNCSQAKSLVRPQQAGIHASFFFSPDGIATKLKSYAHREFATEDNLNIDKIKEKIKKNQPPDGRKRDIVANDPITDLHIMAFGSAARDILLAHSKELRRVQELV